MKLTIVLKPQQHTHKTLNQSVMKKFWSIENAIIYLLSLRRS